MKKYKYYMVTRDHALLALHQLCWLLIIALTALFINEGHAWVMVVVMGCLLACQWRVIFGPAVILEERVFSGLPAPICFRSLLDMDRSNVAFPKLTYDNVGAITDNKFLGMKFKNYHSLVTPASYISIPYSIKNAQECFDLLDKRIKEARA